MASKALKPVLEGQRLKSRKRDVKDKFDASAFRKDVLPVLADADYDEATEFLEKGEIAVDGGDPRKLDYHEYADTLFDIMICGGTLAPGGVITFEVEEETKRELRNSHAALQCDDDLESQKKAAEMVRAVVRRYKFLQVGVEESYTKILKFLTGFSEEQVLKLAQSAAFMLAMNLISTKPLANTFELTKMVENGTVLKFATTLFQTWLQVRNVQQVGAALKKGQLENRLQDFFPPSKRGLDDVVAHFSEAPGLDVLAKWYIAQQTAGVKLQLGADITARITEGATQDELIEMIRAVQVENKIPESQIARLMWPALMNAVEWNKKPEIVIEQALRHVKANLNLIARFTKSDRAQVVLMVAMQEHAYQNQTFLKIFSRLCLLFYKADALGEDAILEWYNKSHSQQGRSAFLQEMKAFVDWLKTAEYED